MRIETTLALVSAVLFVLSLVRRDWIEAVFGVDPDGHSGALEWAIVAAFAGTTLLFGALARSTRRRAAMTR